MKKEQMNLKKQKKNGSIWEDLEEGTGRGNVVIIIKLQKYKKF